MRLGVVMVDVVQVVGGAQSQAELLAEPDQRLIYAVLLVDAVTLDLE